MPVFTPVTSNETTRINNLETDVTNLEKVTVRVSDISALESYDVSTLSLSNGELAQVKDSKRGGFFKLDTSGSLGASAENDITIYPATGGTNYYWIRIVDKYRLNAEWAGVVADGVTDNQSAINKIRDFFLEAGSRADNEYWWEVIWPSGIIATSPVTFYGKADLKFYGVGTWHRNFPSGTVFAPISTTQTHILKFGHPTTPDDANNRLSGLVLENISFFSSTFSDANNLETRAVATLTDALLIIESTSSFDLSNLHFGEGNSRAIRFRHVYEGQARDVHFDDLGDWSGACVYFDTVPSGSNTSALTFDNWHFEAIRGTLIETAQGSNCSDFAFINFHWESGSGATDTVKNLGGIGSVDTLFPLFKLYDVNAFSLDGLKLTQAAYNYFTKTATTYAYGIIFELSDATDFRISNINFLAAGTVVICETDDTVCEGYFKNISSGFPNPNADEAFSYDISSKGKVEVVDVRKHGQADAGKIVLIQDAFERLILSPDVCYYKSDWNRFTKDTDSLSNSSQVFEYVSTGSQQALFNLDAESFIKGVISGEDIRAYIRVKQTDANALTFNLSIHYDDATNDTIAVSGASVQDSWEWMYFDVRNSFLNPSGKNVSYIRLIRTAGLPLFDAFYMTRKNLASYNERDSFKPQHSLSLTDDESTTINLNNGTNTNGASIVLIGCAAPGIKTGAVLELYANVLDGIDTGTDLAIGASANPDTDGKLNVWADSSGVIGIKNRLGSTRTVLLTAFSMG